MPTIDELQKNVERADAAFEQAVKDRESARNALDDARVEAMDESVVQQATDLNINPRNYETTEHLQDAIRHEESRLQINKEEDRSV